MTKVASFVFAFALLATTVCAQKPADSPERAKLIKGGRKTVDSSSIVSIGYDEDQKILEVELPRREKEKQRRIYQYLNVPPKVHKAFMAAESKGRYYDENVKTRYKHREVTPK
jgi:membrane peptidoglycan carboxypeptidase